MDSHLSGFRELVYLKTDKVRVTIKGNPSHPFFRNAECNETCSEIKVLCSDSFSLSLQENEEISDNEVIANKSALLVQTVPFFYEQQRYEIIIESDVDSCTFWHENKNVRKQVSQVGRNSNILTGVLNFGNDIGYSDLIIQLGGKEYLRIVIEVFPSKIEYKKDYKELINDIISEVFKIIFDFNKKTYSKFGSNLNNCSSLSEFYSLINYFFLCFIKSVDIIIIKPNHILEKKYEIKQSHKVKYTDIRSVKWLQKHSSEIVKKSNSIKIKKILSPIKIVTFDTKENRFVKYILITTKKRLEDFKSNYNLFNKEPEQEIIQNIDFKIAEIDRRLNNSFLKSVSNLESSFGMSLVFSMALGYRDLYKCYLKLIHGLSFIDDVFSISVKDIAQLYEYWCFIKLNSILRNKYNLVSKDYLKIENKGLFYTLKKGQESKVSYRNPINGEKITLSYNPSSGDLPTVFQKPDNVLSIEKKSFLTNQEYKYIFDAKYRINPALPGSMYEAYYKTPGPEEDTINTMHRYRDAIVYENGDMKNFNRSMFGAYVLFPYSNQDEYQNHKFYKSIEKVNVGGFPFLPSATTLVSNFIDELIGDSPDSAFERSTLPLGFEEKLSKVDWSKRDVLIGELKDREQYELCKKEKFYHFPANQIVESQLPIHYVAIYKSRKLFENESGIYEYGEVVRCYKIPRNHIIQRPSVRTDEYYKLEIKEWIPLNNPISVKEFALKNIFLTNMFLLQNSSIYPELFLKNELEFRLYSELKYHMSSATPDKKELGFVYKGTRITFEDGKIFLYKDGIVRYSSFNENDFIQHPNLVFKSINSML